MNKTKGFTLIEVAIVLALLGGGFFAVKKGWFSGDTHRANTSVQTTQNLNNVNAEKDGKTAAVFAAIGTTNAEAPDSPQKKVIGRFVPIGLSFTGAPDADYLRELDKLKIAELQGKIDQANSINDSLLKDSASLRRDLSKALAAKSRSDEALQEAAAELRGAQSEKYMLGVGLVLAAVLYLWAKVTHFSPGQIAQYVTDIRSGAVEANQAINQLDVHASPIQQKIVNFLTRLKAF